MTFSNRVTVVNATKPPLSFQDLNTTVVVEPCGEVIDFKSRQATVRRVSDDVELVRYDHHPTNKGLTVIEQIELDGTQQRARIGAVSYLGLTPDLPEVRAAPSHLLNSSA